VHASPKRKDFNVLIHLDWLSPVALRAIGHFAREANWHMETGLIFTDEVPAGWRGDGLLASYTSRADLRRFLRRQASRQPTVVYGPNELKLPAPSVMEDNVEAGRLVARHFLENNHRHFAWLTAYYGRSARSRRDGFIEELRRAGHSCALLEYHAPPDGTAAWPHRRQWLARRLGALPRPLALFALDDQRAAEAITVCSEQGWHVPKDIAVAGVGNHEFACEGSLVPLTSVDLREDEIVRRACALLDNLMRSGQTPNTDVVVPPRGLVMRQSTDALAVIDPDLRRAVHYMRDHLAEPLRVEHIAEAVGLSRIDLYHRCQSELQRTPADQLRAIRLEQARRLLKNSGESVEDIAAACGFGTRRTFDRCFIRMHKMPPVAWREKHRKDPSKE
jgi:LacI family transcriptional regulator